MMHAELANKGWRVAGVEPHLDQLEQGKGVQKETKNGKPILCCGDTCLEYYLDRSCRLPLPRVCGLKYDFGGPSRVSSVTSEPFRFFLRLFLSRVNSHGCNFHHLFLGWPRAGMHPCRHSHQGSPPRSSPLDESLHDCASSPATLFW
jgi:hypothetical protein